jgi:hypothetical protein
VAANETAGPENRHFHREIVACAFGVNSSAFISERCSKHGRAGLADIAGAFDRVASIVLSMDMRSILGRWFDDCRKAAPMCKRPTPRQRRRRCSIQVNDEPRDTTS